jgi:hypothetical protein
VCARSAVCSFCCTQVADAASALLSSGGGGAADSDKSSSAYGATSAPSSARVDAPSTTTGAHGVGVAFHFNDRVVVIGVDADRVDGGDDEREFDDVTSPRQAGTSAIGAPSSSSSSSVSSSSSSSSASSMSSSGTASASASVGGTSSVPGAGASGDDSELDSARRLSDAVCERARVGDRCSHGVAIAQESRRVSQAARACIERLLLHNHSRACRVRSRWCVTLFRVTAPPTPPHTSLTMLPPPPLVEMVIDRCYARAHHNSVSVLCVCARMR